MQGLGFGLFSWGLRCRVWGLGFLLRFNMLVQGLGILARV